MKAKATNYKVMEFSAKTMRMTVHVRGLCERDARKIADELNTAEGAKEVIESTFAPMKDVPGKHLPIVHV
jgi:hypothetical protein